MLPRCETAEGCCTQKHLKTLKTHTKKTNKWTKSGESCVFKDRPPLPSRRSTHTATTSLCARPYVLTRPLFVCGPLAAALMYPFHLTYCPRASAAGTAEHPPEDADAR